MLGLAIRNLRRRPFRTGLTLAGLAVSTGLLTSLLAMSDGYQQGLRTELNRMGMQMMLVPLGCPYDAAARVLKGRDLNVTLPESALLDVRADAAVAVAAPMYTAAMPRPASGRTDLWMGIDDSTRELKSWWKFTPGSTWFTAPDTVILGADAAQTEMRKPGDLFYCPEAKKELRVCGVLERTGTSDDSLFFVPLATAQALFHQPNRLSGIAIRLKDPGETGAVAERLQKIKGAQVVTMAEMMGTFLNLLGAARSLVLSIAIVAIAVSLLSVFNTMMASVLERTRELGVLRALGLSRFRSFCLMAAEATLLGAVGGTLGIALAVVGGPFVERTVRPTVPLAPNHGLVPVTLVSAVYCLALSVIIGLGAGLYPAWRASRLRPAEAVREG